MKIAIFTPSFLPKTSGAEIFHHNLASKLVEAGHHPVLIIPARNVRELRQMGWELPYPVISFPANLWSLFKRSTRITFVVSNFLLNRLQKKHRFDVWHLVVTYPTGVAGLHWGGGEKRVPCILRVVGDDLITDTTNHVGLRCNPLIDRLIVKEISKARAVVSLSESTAQAYTKLGIPAERIHFIPNAVDTARFLRKREVRNAQFVFLSVGRNHPQKDYPTLLKAVGMLAAMGRSFRVVILGRKSSELDAQIQEWNLGHLVETREIKSGTSSLQFPPDELIDAYLSADAFVMPSLMEGFSTAMLEAMAAGLPIITTDAPGCRELIRDGQDGIMVPRSNPAALAHAMLQLLEDSELRERQAATSRKRAAEFSWDLVVGKYLDLYQKLITEQQSSVARPR